MIVLRQLRPSDQDHKGCQQLKHLYPRFSGNQVKNLVTLDEDVPLLVLDWACPKFEHDRESVIEMVLGVARVVFGLSSYIGN